MNPRLPGPLKLALVLNFSDRHDDRGRKRRTLALDGVIAFLSLLGLDDLVILYTPTGIKGPVDPPQAIAAVAGLDTEWHWRGNWEATWKTMTEWLSEEAVWAGFVMATDCAEPHKPLCLGLRWFAAYQIDGLIVEGNKTPRLEAVTRAADLTHLHLADLSRLGEVMGNFVLGQELLPKNAELEPMPVTTEPPINVAEAKLKGDQDGEGENRVHSQDRAGGLRWTEGWDNSPISWSAAQGDEADWDDHSEHDQEPLQDHTGG